MDDTQSTPGLVFGDESTASRYASEVAAAKAAQRTPYAVAPRRRVLTPGRVFEAGEPITPAELAIPGGEPPEALLRRMIRDGLVIPADHAPVAVKGQVATVAPGRSITSPRGILGPGDGIGKGDFDAETLSRLVERGLVVML